MLQFMTRRFTLYAYNENLVQVGEAFEVAENHEAWIVGDTPCVALDFIHLPR